MRKLLFVGDAACPSGFAQATHAILDVAREQFDVTVLGINYRGDPHTYPYPIYVAAAEGDVFGVLRVVWMCDKFKPDLIVLQNDGWNLQMYVRRIQKIPEYASVPIVAIVAVDGKNFRGEWLKGVSLAIFWTEFALREARAGGYEGPAEVIPLGVNLATYFPMDKYEARFMRKLPRELDDAFIVGNVNRNQPRKRWDLTIKYFAEWIKDAKIQDARLFLHTAPTGDDGCDVEQLVRYYDIAESVVLVTPPTWYGYSEHDMRLTYNCFDVQVSTTQGEGFGLTTLEGMACGIPQIVPDWSALGEWAKRGAWLVPCSTTGINPVSPGLNVIGGIPDQKAFTLALNRLYRDKAARQNNSQAALECASMPRYRWPAVAQMFTDAFVRMPDPMNERVWQDLGRPTPVIA